MYLGVSELTKRFAASSVLRTTYVLCTNKVNGRVSKKMKKKEKIKKRNINL